jgi:glycogen debranching enzyme
MGEIDPASYNSGMTRLWWALIVAGVSLPAQPIINKPAQSNKFLESVGRRSMILGREDGTFEAWINPIKILREFRLSVYFDGALEPAALSDIAESVEVRPGRVTITHSHAAFTIRQTWFAPVDRQALVVLLSVDTDRPLRLRASFLPEFKPMWPASFGGQSTAWNAEDHALIFGEGLRRYRAWVGSPAFGRSSEQVGHQLPDRSVYLESEVTKSGEIPIAIAASRDLYRAALADYRTWLTESDAYYQKFEERTMRVETPEPILNHAFAWARYALEKGWACNEGVGCGPVAGFGPSGASERPGFAWYFGGDAFMNSWAVADYGDFERVREMLAFLRDHQRADGKMMHELPQSAALLDWSKYPYGYYHGDTTPLYIFAMYRYVRRSGDLLFLRESWDSIEKAYALARSAVDESDGLLNNKKAGAAAIETGALAGRVEKDVYLQGVWLAALDAYDQMGRWLSKPPSHAIVRLGTARASLAEWLRTGKGLAFGKLTDGSMYDGQSSWQGFALAYGGLDPILTRVAASSLTRRELSTAWGTRLFATDSPFYDPLSYNDGSVWPFVTGFASMAEFKNGAERAGLEHLFGVAAATGLQGAGFVPEYMSGERFQALPRSVPHQLFSSSAVVHPLVSGLLGLDGDAIAGELSINPRLPAGWKRVTFENYRVGESRVSGELVLDEGQRRIKLEISGPALRVIVREMNFERTNKVETSLAVSEEAPLQLIAPKPGDRAR